MHSAKYMFPPSRGDISAINTCINFSECINVAATPDTAVKLAPPSAHADPPLMSDPRVLANNRSSRGQNQAPPTDMVCVVADQSASDEMACHVDLLCFCDECEPLDHDLLSTTTHHSSNSPCPSVLHTGWPLFTITSPTDNLTTQCLFIYDTVRATGVPNFLQARVPLPHQLCISQWRHYLHGHTNLSLVDFLEFGFPVGFDPVHPLESTERNHGSSLQYPDHVQAYLAHEVACHAMLGPFPSPPFWPWSHLNPIMTRPKKDSTDRRVILDLSWPIHASVNDGTQLDTYLGEQYKLVLPTVDDFAQILATYGTGTYMWGLDLRRAFRQIRTDPLDWPLICLTWEHSYYINISVAFGIRHGAAFTQRVSQAVCDILDAEQITTLPYIDDYIGAHPSLALATTAYNRSLQLFRELGLELNPSKCVPPTTTITWIGVVFDSQDMSMRIPPTVITDTLTLVHTWLQRTTATRHNLQVLLGKLFHAGKCCLAARLFVGRMLATLRATTPSGSITLSHSFRADLQWWQV